MASSQPRRRPDPAVTGRSGTEPDRAADGARRYRRGGSGHALFDLPAELRRHDVARRVIGEFAAAPPGGFRAGSGPRAASTRPRRVPSPRRSGPTAYLLAFMPYGPVGDAGRRGGRRTARLRVESSTSPMVDAYFTGDRASALRRVFHGRQRMAVLYDRHHVARPRGGHRNKTESLIATRRLRDWPASARSHSTEPGPPAMRRSACPGDHPRPGRPVAGPTDEGEAGFYQSTGSSPRWSTGGDGGLVSSASTRRPSSGWAGWWPAPVQAAGAAVAARSTDGRRDYLYPRRRPGSTPRLRPGGEAAAGRRRLCVVATPIGNLGDVAALPGAAGRAAHRRRGHPHRRAFARHRIDTRMTSFHARSGPGGSPACRPSRAGVSPS
jgi:hypothetical protein